MRVGVLFVAGLLLAAAGGGGCARAPGTTPEATLGPRETLLKLRDLRAAQTYRELALLVVPSRGRDVVRFVMAVDDFLRANRQLTIWIRDHVGLGISQIIDQDYVADDLALYAGEGLGIFSLQVELLDVTTDADRAVVAYTPGGRLPARQACLRRVEGTWRFDPGPELSELLPEAFHDMARGLDQLRGQLEHGSVPADEFLDNPDRLVELVKARLRRGVALLSKARTGEAPAGG